MKTRLVSASLVSLLSVLSASAAPADDLAAAAKKLAAAANYSWTSTTEMANSQFPAMPVEGVAEKDGFTVVTRTFNDNKSQTVRKGTQVVMQNRDGDWMTGEEMRAQFAGGGGGGGGGGQRGGGGRGGFGGGTFGGAPNPVETIAALAAKIKELKSENGVLVATANGEEAAALLAPPGGRGGQGGGFAPKYSSVTVKFWLKDGALAKYSTHSIGTISTVA
ncbi:MAG: hypothetical protein NTV51_00865 [Verrucomicrobia bacterium]|nr:hypothetical protein [Verrucomicrobiota bacterium]